MKNFKKPSSLITAGYICAFISLFFIPIIFMLGGMIIGIINMTKEEMGHGIVQIILSFICGIIGMALGMAMMM